MKLTPLQIQKLAEKIVSTWKAQNLVTFKVDEPKVVERIVVAIRADYDREAELDREVNKMLDQLERSHQGQFERYKMYPLLKQKMAKEKKVIL